MAARSKSRDTRSPARARKTTPKAAKSPKPAKPAKATKVTKRGKAGASQSRSRSASRGRQTKKVVTPKTAPAPPKTTRSRSSSRARVAPKPLEKEESVTPPTSRTSRVSERRKPQATSTPIRTLRSDSHSPSKTQITKVSPCPLYPNIVCDIGRKAVNFVKENSKDLFISFLIIGLLSVLTHFILFYDPAHIRSHLQSIPGRIQIFAKSAYASLRK
ncbi:unnamed protein product [Auanema sp. JU1783]|nr:unnamed protein product [Auanema sp. JU1783]